MRVIRLLRVHFLMALVMVPLSISGQQEIFLLGQLLDSDTGEGVAFATVRLEGKALGVVSNSDGSFQIPMRFRELGDYLKISSMGYQSYRVPVSDLHPDIVNKIQLHPGIFELSEALLEGKKIKKRSARNIVRTAIRKIPDNYPSTPFGLIGYYRDYQKKSDKYLNLNEAILEVIDQGIERNDLVTTLVRIYDYKPNDEFPKDTLASRPYDYQQWQKVITNAYLYNYGGNEFTILRMHDALRNFRINTYSFVERLNKDFLTNHTFKRELDIYLDKVPFYNISISTRKGYYRAEGTMVISRQDFAVHRMNYALYDGTKVFPNGNRGYAGDNAGRLMFEVQTEYQRVGQSMFLNYISFRNNFRLVIPPIFVVDSVAADLGCQCFQVYFNKVPTRETALDLKHYNAALGGKKIKLVEAKMVDNSVVLVPAEDKKPLLKNLTKFSQEEVGPEIASLAIRGVQDTEGNLVDIPEILEMLQFREFFTQKILQNASLQPNTLYMFKERPLFENQPISRPENFEEYWMNTPLQDIR